MEFKEGEVSKMAYNKRKAKDLAEKPQKGEITKKEARRRRLTPLGWAFLVVILLVFVAFIFLWVYPAIETNPVGAIIRTVVLLAVLAAVSGIAVALGRKKLFRQ
jgi:hypothetical protein